MTRTTGHPPTYEAIAQRAYERYCERGGQDGDDLLDWFEAERELSEAAGAARRQAPARVEHRKPQPARAALAQGDRTPIAR